MTKSIGKRALSGALWTTGFSLIHKSVSIGVHLLLPWYLLPADFGLAAMAFSVSRVLNATLGGSLRDVIVQRTQSMPELWGQVFWVSLVINGGASILLALLANPIAAYYADERIANFIYVLAFSSMFFISFTVYSAKMYANLQFKGTATVMLLQGIVQGGASVVLAVQGYGAAALILPVVLTAIVGVVGSRIGSGSILIARPKPSTWLNLIVPLAWTMPINGGRALQENGVILVIGALASPMITGAFYWGWAISSQATVMLAMNFRNILFPSFTHLNKDPGRQKRAVLSSLEGVFAISAPICILQALLIGPFVTVLFPEHWEASVPVVMLLSVGMYLFPLSVVNHSLLLARGQFIILGWLAISTSVILMLGAWRGSLTGDLETIALYVAIALGVGHCISWVSLCKAQALPHKYLVKNIMLQAVVSVIAYLFGDAVMNNVTYIGETGFVDLLLIIASAVVAIVVYILGMRLVLPSVYQSIYQRLKTARAD